MSGLSELWVEAEKFGQVLLRSTPDYPPHGYMCHIWIEDAAYPQNINSLAVGRAATAEAALTEAIKKATMAAEGAA